MWKIKRTIPEVHTAAANSYAITFIAAVLIQKKFPINDLFFKQQLTKIGGLFLFVFALFFML